MANSPPHAPGTRFGRFRIISFVLNKRGGRSYLCECDCGNVRQIESGKLNTQKSQSCGCLRSDLLRISKKRWPGNPAINSIIAQYRAAARKRSLEWSLTHQLATKLLTQHCFWCGSPPSRPVHSRSHSAVVGGIDRRDNTLGYTEQNAVASCKICNIAKASLTENEWTKWLDRIARFRNRQTLSESRPASESNN